MARSNPLQLSEELLDRFECGDCHILAMRLARVSGWDLATFITGHGNPILHAFVLSPDKREVCDVRGVRSVAAFKREWNTTCYIGTWTRRELHASTWYCPPVFGRYSYAAARRVAGSLLDIYPHLRKNA